MTKSILDLPPEVLACLFSWLHSDDLVNISKSCVKFYEAVNVDAVWQERCYQDYKVTIVSPQFTFKDIYTKMLYKYGKMIGVWRYKGNFHGGLFHVKYDGEVIRGFQYIPPPDPEILEPLKTNPVFIITMDDDSEFLGWFESMRRQSLDGWRLPKDIPTCGSEQFYKFLRRRGLGICERFDMSKECSSAKGSNICPIKPGLFKGTYGPHGIELIMLRFNKETTKLEGFKVTGDVNVPADENSFIVDLNRPMVLTEEQQLTTRMLAQIDTPDIPQEAAASQMAGQIFRVPLDCYDRFETTPSRCRARYHSQGQIAGHNYTGSTFTPNHFIVFDDDMFGVMWIELHSLSMYSRVTEDIS